MTKWTAPDIASIRGDNSRPLQKIFGSLTEYLKDYQNTIDTASSTSSQTFVRNGEATTLTIGTVVYLDAQQGDRATVKRALNTSDATSAKTLGVVAETIAANADGLVTTLGYLEKVNTSAFTAGQTLYLGSTAGTFTSTKPHAPNHMVYVGVVVRANAGNGIIYVRCQNGYELDEIHDVDLITTSPTAGNFLKYNGSLWVAGAGEMSQLDAQTFSSSTTYTIPAASKLIVVECIGAGGGGGAGRRGGGQAGGGGAGGAWERLSIPVSELGGAGASVTVTIGAGGAGAPRATVDGNGSAGSKGGNSRFGTFYFSGAMGGGGGASGGAGERGMGYVGGLAMTVGSEFGTGGRAALVARKGWRGGGGGGAGGYAGASSESDPPLATTGQFYAATTGGGGAAGTGDGGNGTAGGASQGGGGGANGTLNMGGNGGAGGAGGGGAGGGSSAAGINSGAGGTGGDAQIKIWVFG